MSRDHNQPIKRREFNEVLYKYGYHPLRLCYTSGDILARAAFVCVLL